MTQYPHECAPGANGTLWNAVCKTDPAAVKRVEHGRGFSAIDAYSQIKAATELWGPVGKGWGWSIEEINHIGEAPHDLVIVFISLWYQTDGAGLNRFSATGCAKVTTMVASSGNTRTDDDCTKKALTDAITKGLSYLGFNADVFFGGFDDNKYIAERSAEVKAEKRGTVANRSSTVDPTAASGAGTPEQQQVQNRGHEAPSSDEEHPVEKAFRKACADLKLKGKSPPPWFQDTTDMVGKYHDKQWAWFTGGGTDGGRHSYMRHMIIAEKCSNQARTRILWILKTFYGDDGADL